MRKTFFIAVALGLLVTGCAQAPKQYGNVSIVPDGDSLTAGYYADPFGPGSYPSQLGTLLGIPGSQIHNIGVAGAKTSDLIKDHIAVADSLFEAGADNWYVLMIGFNDFNTPVPVETTRANIVQIVAGRKAVGFRVMILTNAPAELEGQQPGYPAWLESENVWILSGASGADYACNAGSQQDLSNPLDLTLYSDGLHDTTEGYRRLASHVADCFDLADRNPTLETKVIQ